MPSIKQLIAQGLIPKDVNIGDKVAFGEYYVCWWGKVTPAQFHPQTFTSRDFLCVYLQIETAGNFERIAVKMSIDEDQNLSGIPFTKDIVKSARQRIQDYFVDTVPSTERTLFQFGSPVRDHAASLTVSRTYFNDANYATRISAVCKAFDDLKTSFNY